MYDSLQSIFICSNSDVFILMVQNKFCRNFRSGKFLCSVACAADANVRFGAWLNAFVASNTVVVCIKLLNSSNSDSIKKYVIIFIS